MSSDNGVEKKILHACRRGDADALRTAAYQLADELYTAALAVLDSEGAAHSAVVKSWQRTLTALQCWRFAGGLRSRALELLRRVLSQMADPQQVQQIAATVGRTRDGRSEARPAPDELVAALTSLSDRMAPTIAEARQRRKHRLRLALAGGLVVLGMLIGLGGAFYNRALAAHNPQLQFEALQQRIMVAELRMAIQQAERQLIDPTGTEAAVRQGYRRISLVLEEIANAANWEGASRLRFIKDRIVSQRLIEIARGAAQESTGKQRDKLMRIVLVLEEAANL